MAKRTDDAFLDDCSGIIVGKNASVTGRVLYGHNEDDGGNNVMVQYKVPAAAHKPGEYVVFETECAHIPQVERTWSYLWSETRTDWKASFSDTFINQWGVAIASDSCGISREDRPQLTNGGIGYGLGHLVAQRACSAREGVEIAADLINRFGYVASGRAYQIVDKDEGWVLQVVKGKHFVAQRVPDDEVTFIPNWYTIHGVDLLDTTNFIVSPDIITYAQERGWYKPARPGSYGDFDFAQAYQDPTQNQQGNIVRDRNAHRLILGQEAKFTKPFSVKPPSKLGVGELKTILRTHYEGTPDDISREYFLNPHRTGVRTICTGTTLESFIVEFRDNPDMTLVLRAILNPCTSPYVPWYLGITKIPGGYGWIEPHTGMETHFSVPQAHLSYRPSRAWWAFQDVQDIADSDYSAVINQIEAERDRLEHQWTKAQTDFEKTVQSLWDIDQTEALARLTEYTHRQARLAWRTWRQLFTELI